MTFIEIYYNVIIIASAKQERPPAECREPIANALNKKQKTKNNECLHCTEFFVRVFIHGCGGERTRIILSSG